jgi:hypothetical protein
MEHEILLIKQFVVKDRQDRYLNLLQTDKGRNKFKSYISHFKDLNKKYCIPAYTLHSHVELYDLLKLEGAPNTCYIISENSKYDLRFLDITDAGKQLFSSGISFFLSCIPGKLAYYEGEDINERFLLKA